jgi:hypothetical protein
LLTPPPKTITSGFKVFTIKDNPQAKEDITIFFNSLEDLFNKILEGIS